MLLIVGSMANAFLRKDDMIIYSQIGSNIYKYEVSRTILSSRVYLVKNRKASNQLEL